VIVAIDGRPVADAQALRNIESLLSVGSRVRVAFLREGRRDAVRVVIEENLDERISGRRLDERLEGAALVRIPERARAQGVLIEDVRRSSPAWNAGLRPGDLVVGVNRQRVRDLAAMRALFPLGGEESFTLDIRRRGGAYRVPFE